MRSRPPTGRSSTTSSSRPASRRSLRPNAGCRRSPTATSASTRRRWPAATHLAGAHLLSPVPNRALVADPPLQPDRADLRRDPPQDQGDRPPTGRAVLPVAGVGGAGPGWRGVIQTPAAVRLLQDLRRQLLHPHAIEEVVAEAVIPAA